MVDIPDYRSRTIQLVNSEQRYAYLAIYPTNSNDFQQYLLHVNVRSDELGSRQFRQRYHEIDDRLSAIIIGTYDSMELYSLTMNHAMDLAQRFRMDLSTLLFNIGRIRAYCSYFFHLYDRYQYKVLRQYQQIQGFEQSPAWHMERHLSSKQMSIIVEFFLQMDVDIFFLKTCSFRGAEPRSTIESIFCDEHGPIPRYSWTFCNQSTCSCCRPINVEQRQSTWPIINHQQLSTHHEFINGYMTYLNCPVTCTTKNIIYAMTCPCQEYDYVASSDRCLQDEIDEHRSNYLRVIHCALTGSSLNENWLSNFDHQESNRLNRMRLYQHVARCPVALKSFLECNPHYWCFIPRVSNPTMQSFTDALGEPIEQVSELDSLIDRGIIDDQRIIPYLERVPLPPIGFGFSFQDRQQQRFFFKQMFTIGLGHIPFRPLDLYTYSIVAVLPEHTRRSTRFILETLFSIHGECKLNMICPCGGDPKRTYGKPYQTVWCIGLQHPTISMTTSTGSTSDLFTCL